MNIYTQFKILCLRYNVDNKNSKTLWNLIKPICLHPEFKKRNYSPFWHHDATTLGEHIMSDAIVTYKMIYKIKNSICCSNDNYNFFCYHDVSKL